MATDDTVGLDLEAAIERQGPTSEFGRLLSYFRFAHLPPALRDMSRHFAQVALVLGSTQHGPMPADVYERLAALRKLLEAKDCAVRSILP